MIHDPHCPAPEMCSDCFEVIPESSDHECEDPYVEKMSIWPVVFVLGILWTLILLLARAIWSAWPVVREFFR